MVWSEEDFQLSVLRKPFRRPSILVVERLSVAFARRLPLTLGLEKVWQWWRFGGTSTCIGQSVQWCMQCALCGKTLQVVCSWCIRRVAWSIGLLLRRGVVSRMNLPTFHSLFTVSGRIAGIGRGTPQSPWCWPPSLSLGWFSSAMVFLE